MSITGISQLDDKGTTDSFRVGYDQKLMCIGFWSCHYLTNDVA